MPQWYEDPNGLRLQLCLTLAPCALAAAAVPGVFDPALPLSFPTNFPDELFYWRAVARMTTSGTDRATLVLATESTFPNGVIAGQGTAFSRIRVVITGGLVPGATYTVTEPYGVDTLTADARGGARFTEDVGCLLPPCVFKAPIGGRVGPWLRWDPAVAPAPPPGFLGTFAVLHAVTGSPLGTNFFRIDGPNVGGPGINTIQTNLFNLLGRVEGPTLTASPAGGTFGTRCSVTLTASNPVPAAVAAPPAPAALPACGTLPAAAPPAPAALPACTAPPAAAAPLACAPSIYFTTDGSDPVIPLAGAPPAPPTLLYTGPIALPSTPGAITTTTLKFQAVGIGGGISAIQTQAFTIDLLPPTVSLVPVPALTSQTPSFTFSANKAGVTFQCAPDTAPLVPCTSPLSIPGLAGGSHIFTVQATDVFGRVSAPASASFKVQGTDPAGNSASASTAFTIDTTPPSSTGLTARAVSASEIDLSWTAATDNVGVAGYKIFRDGGTTPIGTVTSGTTFADTGLAPASTHHYTLVAFDAAGNQSAPSSAVATTQAVLAPETGLQAAPATRIPTLHIQRGIIAHGTIVVVRVRTRANADALITLRLTRQSTHCTGAAPHRVCASVTTVLAQRVMHARANRQGLVTLRVPLGYTPSRTLRATLTVRVATRYGTVTRAAVVLLQPAPRARQR